MKKIMSLIVVVMMLLTVSFCQLAMAGDDGTTPKQERTLIYEAFFLDNDEVLDLFTKTRGPLAPHEIMTKDFHVTTAFMPEHGMSEFYGTEVTVQIYAYQDGEITTEEGTITENEGFFCNIRTENEELQKYIDNMVKNWHITGSYKDQGGAKYTELLDLTDALDVEYTVKGRFGGFMSDGNILFSNEE